MVLRPFHSSVHNQCDLVKPGLTQWMRDVPRLFIHLGTYTGLDIWGQRLDSGWTAPAYHNILWIHPGDTRSTLDQAMDVSNPVFLFFSRLGNLPLSL